MFQTVISFDMRAPAFGAPSSELYPAALEMCEFADRAGIEAVILPEHHASEDGYNPVPALLATAIAARTTNLKILLGAIVLPLHDPVEVAETIAVTDIISGGRLYTTLCAGYVPGEFRMFGKSLKDRARLMDEGLEVITRALSGERFEWQGREVFVRPLPMNQPPRLLVGGGVPATARRAARFGLGLWSLAPETKPGKSDIIEIYRAECARLGHAPGIIMSTHPAVHVARDPDAEWERIGPHVIHLVRSYAEWGSDADSSSSPFAGLDSLDAIRNSGMINVLTPDQAVELSKRTAISLTPLISGLPPEIGWEMLELFVAEVLPRIKAE